MIENLHLVRITPYTGYTFDVTREAWNTALQLSRVNASVCRAKKEEGGHEYSTLKVPFIKTLRLAFGLGLKEAKYLYEEAERENASVSGDTYV